MGSPERLAHVEGSRFCQGKDWGARKSAPPEPCRGLGLAEEPQQRVGSVRDEGETADTGNVCFLPLKGPDPSAGSGPWPFGALRISLWRLRGGTGGPAWLESQGTFQAVCGVSCVLSRVRLFATPWAAARQTPLPMGFSRQESCSGYHFLLQGIPDPGMEPVSPAWAGRFFATSTSCREAADPVRNLWVLGPASVEQQRGTHGGAV